MPTRLRLLFDSAQVGRVVGTRAPFNGERSLLFRAGSLCVDLVLFAPSGGIHVAYGQVIDAATDQGQADARVRCGTRGRPASADQYGQFSLSSLEPIAGQTVHIQTSESHWECAVPAPTSREGGVL